MTLEILTIEVGSTITKINGFRRLPAGGFEHLAQGFAPTSVARGDVSIGVNEALAFLSPHPPLPKGEGQGVRATPLPKGVPYGDDKGQGVRATPLPKGVPYGDDKGQGVRATPLANENAQQVMTFVNSSAAGGLRMTVHGLTYSMTARAAREAALGAGGIVKMVTAGALSEYELDEIRAIHPNIILLAGGVDYGEKDIVLKNAEKLAGLRLSVPVLYAGNKAIRTPVQQIFQRAGIETLLAENVFPDVDVLNIEPLRRVIHEVFNRHIIHAPGMAKFAELTQWGILPTPGAVLRAAELFAEALGDCIIFDVGGATTDVHSVTEGSLEWSKRMVEPEPYAKRTVEGDLGVFVNAHNILEMEGDPAWQARAEDLAAMPATERQKELTRWLCTRAVETGIKRHAGIVTDLYTPTGKKQVVKGKDLTAVQWVIGTGGALTRIEGGADILRGICTGAGKYLFPPPTAKILIDRDYRFSALGTLAQAYPEDVKITFKNWVQNL